MNNFFWLSVPLIFLFSQTVFAACNQPPMAIFQDKINTITNFSYQQTFSTSTAKPMLMGCNPTVRVNSYFNAALGNTDLTGSSPFSVVPTVMIMGSTADSAVLNDAKTWLAGNFKISFNLGDNNKGKPAKSILNLNTNYNILPETAREGVVPNSEGEPFFNGAGLGRSLAEAYIDKLTINFTNTVKPSAAIITALNGATVRIHLGTYHYKYATHYNALASAEVAGSLELYQDLTLNFNFPTCTVANQIVNLSTVPISILNTQQTASEQNFTVNINCTMAMPNKVLLATITDSYTPSNINNDGILKNLPSLENRSNVDVQLRDERDVPLAIGRQGSFYSIPVGSTLTRFVKALKARYFRSAATASSGFVQTQATVFLDYQ
ncbi:fimbrial protein [Acinetobacter guillouiae]|uniref:fimbrial protein n=1 Tax=Acinetobacter guillouiae TaxID=106649 RepID=UPI0028D726E8|nr:fimbrial protein [Acinetobacter guillouiae]